MKFYEQRRSPSRPLFSQARACPCPRRLCYEKTMPAAHAAVLGPVVPPESGPLVLSLSVEVTVEVLGPSVSRIFVVSPTPTAACRNN